MLDGGEEIQRSLGIVSPGLWGSPDGNSLNGSPVVAPQRQRLESLDVFRGLTILLMIFVSDLGQTWPEIHHVPWNGMHLADIVMPWFLFMVGFAVPIAVKKQVERDSSIGRILTKIGVRTLKLFVLGLVLQGGGLPHSCEDNTQVCLGWDIQHIRIPGVLQRIAVAYLVTSITVLSSMLTAEPVIKGIERKIEDRWDPAAFAAEASDQERMRALLGNREMGVTIGVGMSHDSGMKADSNCKLVCHAVRNYRRFVLFWIMTGLIVVVYLCLTLFTAVGSYDNPFGEEVRCGDGVHSVVRGRNSPACSPVGYYERLLK